MKINLEDILRLNQSELKKYLSNILTEMNYKVQNHKGFLYAKGNMPILLVAHMDTVHKNTPNIICYSKDGKYVMSPNGIGGDDRCGIYMILEIIKNHKCSVLFTEDEEIGCVGANEFVSSGIIPDVNYIIEIDRAGGNDCVFYDCVNMDFVKFIEKFGFETAFGSFSDISVIAPHLNVSAVNISSGYYNPHCKNEYINIDEVKYNIIRINEIIKCKTDKFIYIEDRSKEELFDYYEYQELFMPLEKGMTLVYENGKLEEVCDDGDYFMNDLGEVAECVEIDYMEQIPLLASLNDVVEVLDSDLNVVNFDFNKSEECGYLF